MGLWKGRHRLIYGEDPITPVDDDLMTSSMMDRHHLAPERYWSKVNAIET